MKLKNKKKKKKGKRIVQAVTTFYLYSQTLDFIIFRRYNLIN